MLEKAQKKIVTGINGFGRFGLHLLKYWLDRNDDSDFAITYINDDYFSIDQAFAIINTDRSVLFDRYKVALSDNHLLFLTPNGKKIAIEYTFGSKTQIPWLGHPEIILECSGKSTQAQDCHEYITGNTKLVIISATSWDADKTIVYGFNDQEFSNKLRCISYGSCTVNAYVPLANFINETFGVLDSDVNVIHNVQHYKLPDFDTLDRRFCTLERSAPQLLSFLNKDNFIVNYTLIPYSGVSMIDFRFRIKKSTNQEEIVSQLSHSLSNGVLKGLYSIEERDTGPEAHICTTFSSVFIKERIRLLGDNLYMFAYFDNENSVNRYYDLTQKISQSYSNPKSFKRSFDFAQLAV